MIFSYAVDGSSADQYSDQSQDVYKTVSTKSGMVRGLVDKTLLRRMTFVSYKGIPYAKPPIGELRFKAPEPVEPWSNVLNTFQHGNKCPQISSILPATSENCLFLNIYTPVVNVTKKVPVLVYIHGGLFVMGSGNDGWFGPDFFIESEIILVTMNYRLGILGFMSLGTEEYSGNMGMKDQQLALKWIYENIERFGGDNEQITISGQSAGSKSLGFHLVNEQSSMYFNQMISMSGTSNTAYSYQSGDHRCLMQIFANKYSPKCLNNDDELIEFLKSVPVSKIIEFTTETVEGLQSPWNPVIEKSNSIRPFLREDINVKLQTTTINKNAYFTFTPYEELLFTFGKNYTNANVIDAYLANFSIDLPIHGYSSSMSRKPYLNGLMNQIRDFYFGEASTDLKRLEQRLIMDSDLHYIYFIEKWIQGHVAASQKNTFYHRFSVVTPLNPHIEFQGASHTDDLCYVFKCRRFDLLYKGTELTKNISKYNQKISNAMENMMKLFSNFIKYGNPTIYGNPIEEFKPVQVNELNFVDVTLDDGLISGVSPNGNRTQFLDYIVEETKRLVEENGDSPKDTLIQQQCKVLGKTLKRQC
ncbi:esterase B1-like isoform X2 [Contarinia nasturtii]|uniref:esterase B1-like isoform X2 n=1 Tax=Contarinia nasturtii TaxID=265458 RepID=UPI0012D42A58|nr:esterase B1-like isoform X2 [Contarinia nasturtii]